MINDSEILDRATGIILPLPNKTVILIAKIQPLTNQWQAIVGHFEFEDAGAPLVRLGNLQNDGTTGDDAAYFQSLRELLAAAMK